MIVLYKPGVGVGVSSLDSKSVDPDSAGQMPFILSLFKLIVRSVRYLDHLFFDEKNHHEHLNMGVDPKIGGKPPKWMVKIMENPIKMDDLGAHPYFWISTHMVQIVT